MKYDQLVQLYFERSTALQNYWTLYVVIVGGLLAFASMRQTWSKSDIPATILISILFIVFAYRNCGAIQDVTQQRQAAVDAIHVVESSPDAPSPMVSSKIDPTLISPDFSVARNFHIAGDVLTLAALWMMHRRRRLTVAAAGARATA
jgi:hypothetical protein